MPEKLNIENALIWLLTEFCCLPGGHWNCWTKRN